MSPRCRSEIQSTPPPGHPAPTLSFEPILVVTMPGVAETFKSIINKMTYGTDFKLINMSHVENANVTNEDVNTTIDEPEI